ncbi:A-kinase anchor protein 9-like [Electrophorus electricus]|uniref:A-kinase anchor protein 9-like n=1 Tax=Electrophorus electricus TaxID=8005 RepID=UPI0015D03624|nr:A-kinase anchor protein 9-like [Electrophorus electricus]
MCLFVWSCVLYAVHPTASQVRDGYTSDSSSDWSQRTGFEFRSTPEGARPDDPDLLPDRVKTLLREVHQEGMQVLSLSELPVPEGGQSGAQLPLQAWRKEREALLDTVESLKELLTQLQTRHHTQTHTQDIGERTAIAVRVFSRGRGEHPQEFLGGPEAVEPRPRRTVGHPDDDQKEGSRVEPVGAPPD